MRFLKLNFRVGVFLLSMSVAGFAQGPVISAEASNVTEFDVNGLKVILKRRAAAPTVSVGLFIRGGVRNYDVKTAGIENLMVNAALEAGRSHPRRAVRREIARSGGSMGGSAGPDFSVMSFASTRDNFERLWRVFADVTMNPLFDTQDVDRVREQIMTGLREQETAPDGALEVLKERTLFAGHPYANDPAGTLASVAALQPAQLREHHKRLMETSRLLLVVVGDIDAANLRTLVTSSFGKLPRGSYKHTRLPALDFGKPTIEIATRQLPTNYVKGDFAAPTLGSDDYYPMRVAISVLKSRIFLEVRERRQLSYAPDADMSMFEANTANIYVTAVDANQAVDVMLKEIERLKKEPLTDTELLSTAGEFLTSYYLKQQTNTAQALDLARYELIGGGWRKSFEFLNRIREVTPEAVRSVANKYMKNIRFVVVGDPAAINRSIFAAQQ